jgi:hypothetical protein
VTFPVASPLSGTNTSAALADTWADGINYLQQVLEGADTAYTPTWSAVTGSPTVGTGGTLVGRYKQLDEWTRVEIVLTLGTAPTFGTAGPYRFTLPVPPVGRHILNGNVRQASTYPIFGETDAASGLLILRGVAASTTGAFGGFFQGTPVTLAATNVVTVSGWYR